MKCFNGRKLFIDCLLALLHLQFVLTLGAYTIVSSLETMCLCLFICMLIKDELCLVGGLLCAVIYIYMYMYMYNYVYIYICIYAHVHVQQLDSLDYRRSHDKKDNSKTCDWIAAKLCRMVVFAE